MKRIQSKSRNAAMHADHREWLAEDALWRDELRIWTDECRTAVADMERIKQAVALHGVRLDRYGTCLWQAEDDTAAHERAIANQERNRTPLDAQGSAAVHQLENERQHERHSRHEELKREHYRIMTLLRLLSKALTE